MFNSLIETKKIIVNTIRLASPATLFNWVSYHDNNPFRKDNYDNIQNWWNYGCSTQDKEKK